MDWLRGELSGLLLFLYYLLPTVAVGAVAVVFERLRPRHRQQIDPLRYLNGAVLAMMSGLMARFFVPVTAAAACLWAMDHGFGLLNLIALPLAMHIFLGFLATDFIGYAFHRLLHGVPLFWRLHRIHHTARVVDAATALRTHPVEATVGATLLSAGAVLFGIHPAAIAIHAGCMLLFNFWHHANIRSLPGQVSLGLCINTPDLHRMHHSAEPDLYNSNYGSVLSSWDRLFRTIVDDTAREATTRFGIDKAEWDHPESLLSLLIDPLRPPGGEAPGGKTRRPDPSLATLPRRVSWNGQTGE